MASRAKRPAKIPRPDDGKAGHRKIITSTPSSVRDVNRALVLDLIRLHEPKTHRHSSEQYFGDRRIVDARAACDRNTGNSQGPGTHSFFIVPL
ncbi:MAG TPA: hypothetical protein VMW54_11945 [Terriglobia bacterium]|nr:hypothetical protein [Terriglobia bacterium]